MFLAGDTWHATGLQKIQNAVTMDVTVVSLQGNIKHAAASFTFP